MLKKEIVKLAYKWVSKFFDETTDHIEFVDRYFADDCENLGFVMKHAPSCGATGNDGKFCKNCGAKRG